MNSMLKRWLLVALLLGLMLGTVLAPAADVPAAVECDWPAERDITARWEI